MHLAVCGPLGSGIYSRLAGKQKDKQESREGWTCFREDIAGRISSERCSINEAQEGGVDFVEDANPNRSS